MNQQTPEKSFNNDGLELDVAEIFNTIQGEGPSAGTPATFIRLAGCNLQCPACDTLYTGSRCRMPLMDIIDKVRHDLVVITGGEPFRQNISQLCSRLVTWHNIEIETNGTLYPQGYGPWLYMVGINVSPKTPTISDFFASRSPCAIKYVLDHRHVDPTDGLPLQVMGSTLRPWRPVQLANHNIYVQPLDMGDTEINRLNREAAIASCVKYDYRLSLQMHKLLGLP